MGKEENEDKKVAARMEWIRGIASNRIRHIVRKVMGKEDNEDKKVAARMERIRHIVRETVAFQFGLKVGETFDDSSSFIDDLGADSLDCVEFVMAIEDIFNIGIPEEEAEKLLSTKNVVDFLCEKDAKSKLDIDESKIPHNPLEA